MKQITLSTTVGDLVSERPGRSRVFENLGIDYCCGGKASLEEASREKGLHPDTVLQMLRAFDDAPAGGDSVDWTQQTLSDLIDHIENTHHAYLRKALPRLDALANRVASRHGHQYPWLHDLRDTFVALADVLEDHLVAEEVLVFPAIQQLEAGEGDRSEEHLQQIEDEHSEAGEALSAMRQIANDYLPPADACNSFRALLEGLAELERDMHQHVHKENNILFPRAREVAF